MVTDDDHVSSNQQLKKEEGDAPMTSAMIEGGDNRDSKRQKTENDSSSSSVDGSAAASSSSSSSSSAPPIIDRSKPPAWNDAKRASEFGIMLGRVGARAAWAYFDRAGAPPIDDDATAVVTSAAMAQSSSSSSSSASTPRAIRIPFGACFECAEMGNADLWYTISRPIGSTTTLTGQLGIRIQVKSSMLNDDGGVFRPQREKLHQYEGMLIVWVRVPNAIYTIVADALYDNNAIVFTLAMMQACEFYMAPMGKKVPAGSPMGTKPIVIKGDANNGGIDDVFESDLYANYINMTPGHPTRAKFDAYFTQLRAPTVSEEAILAHVQRIWTMGAARFDMRTLIETEWQLGADNNYTEQRSSKILNAFWTRMGFTLDICREGADVDIILNGHIRIEVKSNQVRNSMDFGKPKQRRMTDDHDGTRRIDLVIQHNFNNTKGDWSRFIVIPWQAFSKDTAKAADIPLVCMTEKTIDRDSCDQYNIPLGSDGWFERLINRINMAGGVATSIPDPNLTAPNAEFLRSVEYLVGWLRIPDVLFTHRHPMPSSLPIFIAAVNPGFVDPTIASFRYVPKTIEATGHAAWKFHQTLSGAAAVRKANAMTWPICLHPRAVCPGSLRDHPDLPAGLYVNMSVKPCSGRHAIQDSMRDCLKERGVVTWTRYYKARGGVVDVWLYDVNAQRIDAQEAVDYERQMKEVKADNKKNKNNQEEEGEEDDDEDEDE